MNSFSFSDLVFGYLFVIDFPSFFAFVRFDTRSYLLVDSDA